jgi:TolC family type I secretion outer membrane protein
MKKLFFIIIVILLFFASADSFAKKMILTKEKDTPKTDAVKTNIKQESSLENKEIKKDDRKSELEITKKTKLMTIEEVLLYAYQNNESLLSERSNLESIRAAKLKSVGTGFLPDIYLSYKNTDAEKEYEGSGATTNLDDEHYAINLSQPIFRSGRSIIEIKDANMQIKAEEAYLKQIEQDVMYEAIQAYVSMLRDERILSISIENENSLEKSYNYAIARNKVGEATKAEVAISKARYYNSQSDVSIARRNLSFSVANFERVTGISTDDVDKTAQKTDYSFEFQYNDLNVKDTIISRSLDNNPALKLAKVKYEIQKNNLNLKKTEFLPTVTLDASKTKGEDYSTTYDQKKDYDSDSVSLSVKVPLFQSGVEYSNLKVAQSNVSKTKYDFNYAKNKIIEEASKSYDDFLASKSIINSTKSYVDAIELSLKSTEAEERLGSKTIIDVLDIRREYQNAKISMIKAESDNILAYFKVKSVLGELNPSGLNLINNKR